MSDWLDRVMLQAIADEELERIKPCCERIRNASGSSSWCALPDQHQGDHHGLSAEEFPLPVNEYRKGMKR